MSRLPLLLLLSLATFHIAGSGFPAAQRAIAEPTEETGRGVRLPPISPPKLAASQVTLPLPGPVDEVVVGGGGRFLILHFKSLHRVGVFDVNEGRVVRYLSADDDQALVAVGAEKLFVVLGEKRMLLQYSLATLERESAAPMTFPYRIGSITMGSASNGPLLVGPRDVGWKYLDNVAHLYDKPNGQSARVSGLTMVRWRYFPTIRAAANGEAFTLVEGGGSVWVMSGQDVDMRRPKARELNSPSPSAYTEPCVVPDFDARLIYGDYGVFTMDMKPLGDRKVAGLALPAVSGPYSFVAHLGEKVKFTPKVTIHVAGQSREIATIDDVGITPADAENYARDFDIDLDQRFHYIPAAKLFVFVPRERDRLVLTQFDLEAALARQPNDYLLVISRPPLKADPGKPLSYQVVARSKRGGLKYKLETAPDGMRLSERGLLTWVPVREAKGTEKVVISIHDTSDQQVFHTFDLAIGPQPAPAREEYFGERRTLDDKERKELQAYLASTLDEAATPRFVTPLPPQPLPGIKPPKLDGQSKTLKLPGRIQNVAIGGGGRYVILHLPASRQLAVFDVNTAAIVKHIPADDDHVLFTAGAEHLILILGNKGVISRWSLKSLERELTIALEVPGRAVAACMGSSSAGPICCSSSLECRRRAAWRAARTTAPPISWSAASPAEFRPNLIGKAFKNLGNCFTRWR